jgi:mannose-6-phosphate isomerase-like protein (cupin superfamily)
MKLRFLLCAALIAAVSSYAGALWAQQSARPALDSRIWSAGDARVSKGSWGSIAIYTEDGQPSFGTNSVLTAELEFLPGKQLQPPHPHADEEFQYVIEGAGTWSLNGREFPLKKGDLMYSKPWDWHGIRNSGDQPLRFFVFKWKAKGVPEAAKPAG